MSGQSARACIAAVMAGLLICVSAVPAAARECKTFPGVTQSIADCAREASEQEYDMVVDPLSTGAGTVTTETLIGRVILSFDLDETSEEIQYCIVSKPWIVTVNQIFDGIEDKFNGCRRE